MKCQKEKNKYHMLIHICGIYKNSTDEPISKQEYVWRMDVWTQREGEGGTNWTISIHRHTTMFRIDS